MLDESIVGELAGLGKAVHAFADFDKNVSVVDGMLELVFFMITGIHMNSY
jgi:hypothetical protein